MRGQFGPSMSGTSCCTWRLTSRSPASWCDPPEAAYLVNFTDDSGARFSGDSRYELQFTGGNLPPVDAFWSLTMYAADYNLVANPANRYSIGDRTPGVVKSADGGMTLYIQASSPGADKGIELAALPCRGHLVRDPADVPAPRRGRAGKWRCPAVRKVS